MIPKTNVKKILKNQFKSFKNEVDQGEIELSKRTVKYLYDILEWYNDDNKFYHNNLIKTLNKMKKYTDNIDIITYIDIYLFDLVEQSEIITN